MFHFTTYEEAAEWFDTHDMADYEEYLIPVDFGFDLRKNRDWVELDGDLAQSLRKLAHKQHISTRTLVNKFLKEKVHNL